MNKQTCNIEPYLSRVMSNLKNLDRTFQELQCSHRPMTYGYFDFSDPTVWINHQSEEENPLYVPLGSLYGIKNRKCLELIIKGRARKYVEKVASEYGGPVMHNKDFYLLTERPKTIEPTTKGETRCAQAVSTKGTSGTLYFSNDSKKPCRFIAGPRGR